jgi:hypothetical protein
MHIVQYSSLDCNRLHCSDGVLNLCGGNDVEEQSTVADCWLLHVGKGGPLPYYHGLNKYKDTKP